MLRLFANAKYDFIAVRRYAYAVTALFIIPGVLFLLIRGLNYSIEFTGGTLVQIHAQAGVTDAQIRAGLDANGLRGAEVQGFGAPGDFVIRARTSALGATDPNNTQATAAAVTKALDGGLGAGKYRVDRTEASPPSSALVKAATAEFTEPPMVKPAAGTRPLEPPMATSEPPLSLSIGQAARASRTWAKNFSA